MQFIRALVIPASLLGLFASGPACAAGASASAFSANFTTDGVNTAIDPVNTLSSGPDPRYDKTHKAGAYHNQLILTDAASPPALTVDTSGSTSRILGIFGIDTSSAEGDATVTGLNLKLAPYVPPGSNAIPAPYLQITANSVHETANYDALFIVPNRMRVSSAGRFDGLTITGSLVGGKTLKVTGAQKPDTVLFQSDTVTITLNSKLVTALISCSLKCKLTPYSVRAAGVDVALNGAKLGKHKVSGDISVAAVAAGSGRGF
ncbi:MAG TPA: hypothetical protein VL899_16390 [Alphaproteobacteria bacterium]|nr:hypothetical protein [Alphaproteobacteria bacterium]